MVRDPSTMKKYTQAISLINTFEVFSLDVIDRMLHENKQLCIIMSEIRSTAQYFQHGTHINLELQGNCSMLIPPDKIIIGDDKVLNPKFTKQGSDQWLENRKKCVITGSTANAALGIGHCEKTKEHFKSYVVKTEQIHITPEMEVMFKLHEKMR